MAPHQLPTDVDTMRYEITKNRQVISDIISEEYANMTNDLCYPSGIWDDSQFDFLRTMKIETATTLEEGLNTIDTHPLRLKRLCCFQDRPSIEFEASLTGYYFLLNKVRHMFN